VRGSLDVARRTLRFLDRRQRYQWALLVPLAVAVAALETVGALLIFSLIRRLSDPDGAVSVPVAERLLGALPGGSTQHGVFLFAAMVAAFYLLKNAVRVFEIHARERCAEASIRAISGKLLHAYLRAPYVFHLGNNSARLVHNVNTATTTVVREVLQAATSAASHCLVAAGVAAAVLISAPRLALAAGAVVGATIVVLFRWTQQAHVRWGLRVHRMGQETLRTLQQTLSGVKEIHLLGRETDFEATFDRQQRERAQVEVWRRTFDTLPRIVTETLFIFGVALLVSLVQIGDGGDLLAVLGLFAYAGLRILPSLQEVMTNLNAVRFGTPAARELYRDWRTVMAEVPSEGDGSGGELEFRRRIEVRDVSFAYPGSGRPSLEAVSLEIARGEPLGIVGTRGAGKSTLVDVLLGLLPPTEGCVCVDGRDIRTALRAWQRMLGVVPQHVFLIDDSIARNVALGLPPEAVDADRLAAAIATAQLADFVAELPAGIETVVGERGVRLSGGQRQRIAIARALYGDPQVLVMDEATAALDYETERALANAIDLFRREKTLVIIAHRLATIRHCDRLALLQSGRLIDVGSYDELMGRSADFQRMAAAFVDEQAAPRAPLQSPRQTPA